MVKTVLLLLEDYASVPADLEGGLHDSLALHDLVEEAFDLDAHPFHAWAFGPRGTSLLTSNDLPASGSPAPLCAPPTPPHVENKPLPPI